MMFKLRTATNVLVGPSLLFFLKLTSPDNTAKLNQVELTMMGQALSQEGYGEAERCKNVINALKGNTDEAKKILQKIQYTEALLEV